MKNISSAVFTNNKKLYKEDISYIKQAENKLVLLFPIPKSLLDRHALLAHFKHVVTRRFLMEFELETKKQKLKRADGDQTTVMLQDVNSFSQSAIQFQQSIAPEAFDNNGNY